MNYLLIIVLVASMLNLAFNAYLYFTDKSISHVILGISYTAQSALKKATENGKTIDALGAEQVVAGASIVELRKTYLERFQSVDAKLLDLRRDLDNQSLELQGKITSISGYANSNTAMIDDLNRKLTDLTTKLNELEAYVTAPTQAALPEPNEAGLKQEMEDSLVAEPAKNYKVKRISEWLNDLPEPYRQQALDEFERQGWKNMVSFGLVHSLCRAFDWAESPHGGNYWMVICEHIEGVGELPQPWTPPTVVNEPNECNELCGINMCEENGCVNRKRVYVDPPTADGTEAAPEPKPRKSRRNGIK